MEIKRWMALFLLVTFLGGAQVRAAGLRQDGKEGVGPRLTPEEAIAAVAAGYPGLGQGELGADDFRISEMGPDGVDYDANEPDVAYDPDHNQFLVVWSGNSGAGGMASGENEIYGRFVDAATGAPLGPHIRLSDMGPDGALAYEAGRPAVAYNPMAKQYLVVWQGVDNSDGQVPMESEIFGQLVSADTGLEVGGDFRLSDMGGLGDAAYTAQRPDVAYDEAKGVYLVVWYGDDAVDGELEVYGQWLDVAGAEVGDNDLRLSHMGPDANTAYEGANPAVTCHVGDEDCLVVWAGADTVAGEYEVWGQWLNAGTLGEMGDEFRISDVGPAGNPAYGVGFVDVAYNPSFDEYLVVWDADDEVNDEWEIWGRRVEPEGAPVQTEFRISHAGPDGDPAYGAYGPTAAWNATGGQYLVAWYGSDTLAPLAPGEWEVLGQRLDAYGTLLGTEPAVLSDMGPAGDPYYLAVFPAVAYGAVNDQYLVVWSGDDQTGNSGYQAKIEVFGQRVDSAGQEVDLDTLYGSMGPDTTAYDAYEPAVAYNPFDNEYLVVWQGIDDGVGTPSQEFEIYGQVIDAATGAPRVAGDIRLSDMGPDGDDAYQARHPAVAFSLDAREYLVVWCGNDDDGPGGLDDNELEIYGQRVDRWGAQAGTNDLRISDMGPDGNPVYNAYSPAVAYNSDYGEWLVVWDGDDAVDNAYQVYGQRLDATPSGDAPGTPVGDNDFRISDMAAYGMAADVAYNWLENEYLVVWSGNDGAPLAAGESEIFGRLLDGYGPKVGLADVRLSQMGPAGDADYDALNPAVAYGRANNEYLVVWQGGAYAAFRRAGGPETIDPIEEEIFGQRVSVLGAEVGAGDFRISTMGPDGDVQYDAWKPDVVYNPDQKEYLVVWYGDDNTPPLVQAEQEVWGRRLSPDGQFLGIADARFSGAGPDGSILYFAVQPAVEYSLTSDEYLVVWAGEDDVNGLIAGEFEILGQRYAAFLAYLPLVLRNWTQ